MRVIMQEYMQGIILLLEDKEARLWIAEETYRTAKRHCRGIRAKKHGENPVKGQEHEENLLESLVFLETCLFE